MEPKNHELKTWPEYFKEVVNGDKTFEVRKNDRRFAVGDLLNLKEYYPAGDYYSGREFYVEVTYILEGGNFGIEKGFVVMGIKNV